MKTIEAMSIISDTKRPSGYRVSFEHVDGGILRSDFFPDRGEPLIETEEEAWCLARLFAARTRGKCVNIYVTDDKYCPVSGYKNRMFENR